MDSEVDNGTFRDWLGEESEKGEGVVKEWYKLPVIDETLVSRLFWRGR